MIKRIKTHIEIRSRMSFWVFILKLFSYISFLPF